MGFPTELLKTCIAVFAQPKSPLLAPAGCLWLMLKYRGFIDIAVFRYVGVRHYSKPRTSRCTVLPPWPTYPRRRLSDQVLFYIHLKKVNKNLLCRLRVLCCLRPSRDERRDSEETVVMRGCWSNTNRLVVSNH